MGRTWLRRIQIAWALVGSVTVGARAQPDIRIDLSSDTSFAAQISIAGALQRLTDRKCLAVFSDFSTSPPDRAAVVPIWFVDGDETAKCRPPTLAFTSPGSRVVHLCAKRFGETAYTNRRLAEAIIIHEILHVYGVGENPPLGDAITARVIARCLR
jgi:hypothetical protein